MKPAKPFMPYTTNQDRYQAALKHSAQVDAAIAHLESLMRVRAVRKAFQLKFRPEAAT